VHVTISYGRSESYSALTHIGREALDLLNISIERTRCTPHGRPMSSSEKTLRDIRATSTEINNQEKK